MPLEYLARVYRSEDAKVSERINAARTLMDYVHRKIPQRQEIETNAGAPKIDAALLRNLTPAELDVLETLVKKMSEK